MKVMKKSAQDREIEKLKKQVEKLKKEKESLQRDAISREGCPLLSQTMPSIVLYSKKKEKPNVGLDKETFERMMNLLDDIITPV